MSSKSHLHQAGNYIHGHFQNHGVQLTGNSFNVNGNFSINTGIKEKDPEKECRRALRMNFSDPIDDRAKILSLKPRLITAICDWVLENGRYKTWRNIRTRSQLLWVSGGQARGKTMLSIFLTQEFDRLAHQHGEITVLYYFIDRQDKRDTAVHVLRGLIARLVAVRKALIQHLVEEYEVQSDIFGPNSIETLWRVFEAMVRDPIAGQVYCVLDGLDACTEESLRRLIGRIRDFFLDEPQTVIDEGPYGGQSSAPRSARPRTKGGAGLKMMLVSREEPEWLKDHLKDFPRISIGGGGSSRKDNAGASSAKPPRKAPKLADIAASIVRKQTMDKTQRKETVVAGPSSAPAVLNQSPHPAPSGESMIPTLVAAPQPSSSSGGIALSSGSDVGQIQLPAYEPLDHTGGTLFLAGGFEPEKQPLSAQHLLPDTASGATGRPLITNPPIGSSSAALTPAAAPDHLQHTITASPRTSTITPFEDSSVASPIPIHPASLPLPVPAAGQLPAESRIEGSAEILPPAPVVTPTPTPTPAPVFHQASFTDEPAEYPPEKPTAEAQAEQEEHEERGDIDDEDPDYNPSLRLYIEAKIEELTKERQFATEVQSFIVQGLEFRGDGTFLWVDFAIEELKKAHVNLMEDSVNSLPPTLDEMYCRILLNIPPSLVDLVIGLLRWAVCARRPMDLLELTVALNLSHYTPNDAMAFILNAVTACGNMIRIGEEDLTVNLVHNSLVELLTGESSPLILDPRLSRFHIQPSLIDGDITTFCISYLESGPFNEHSICKFENEQQYNQHVIKYPFLPYAASFWPDHLRDASNPYLNMSTPFWVTKSKCRKFWWHTFWAHFTGARSTFFAPSNFTILHLAAYLNLVSLAQQIAQMGQIQTRLNKRDSHGMTALDYTVSLGHVPMFMFLVQYNAKQEPVGESVLELACRKNQREMVALLLDMGWNVNLRAQPQAYGSSLYSMARYFPGVWHEGLELDRDAWSMLFRDVGVQETPMHVVATYGHTAVMELLISRGAEINAGTTKGFTPLMSASYTGQKECIDMLIEYGAMMDAVTTDNWLAMHYAAMRGKVGVVELFVDRGIPVDSLTIKSKSALHLAAWAGYVEVVEYLVGKGANIDLKSHKGETPLHLATRHTKPWMVELLLSLGADRTAVNNEGFTALQWAQASNLNAAKECLRILLTYGMEGYVPWQPPEPLNTANAASPGPTMTPQSTGQASDAGAGRRASTAAPPPARSFPGQVPRMNTFQGFEAQASITIARNPPPQTHNPCDPSTPQPPTQPAAPYAAPHPDLGRTHSAPAPAPSKFSYDANANMQQFSAQNTGLAYGSMSPPSAAPPPYSAAVGGSLPPVFSEKSAAWTAQVDATSAGTWQHASIQNQPSVQTTPLAQTLNQPPGQALPQQQHTATASTPTVPQNTGPVLTPISQQSNQGGLVGMLSSMALSNQQTPASTPQVCELPAFTPMVPTSPPQPYQPNPQVQPPQTPNMQAISPSPLMSPFQSHAMPVMSTPYQAPVTPAQQFQPQQPYQTPATPIQQQPAQPFAQQPPQQPIYYTGGLTINTTPSPAPYATSPMQPQHTQQPTNQYLSPQMTPSPYAQPPQTMPVQSPQFSGNSAASMYNSGYQYSAPTAITSYNHNIGQMGQTGQMGVQMQQPGGWQPPNNGTLFAPPPTPKKKKSYLGGFITK